VSLAVLQLTEPSSIPQMIHDWIWSIDGAILRGENRRARRKTCPLAPQFTTNAPVMSRARTRALAAGIRPLTFCAIERPSLLQWAQVQKISSLRLVTRNIGTFYEQRNTQSSFDWMFGADASRYEAMAWWDKQQEIKELELQLCRGGGGWWSQEVTRSFTTAEGNWCSALRQNRGQNHRFFIFGQHKCNIQILNAFCVLSSGRAGLGCS
jgi:hypothetical protein